MSRVGKKPINIPKDVTITLNDKNLSVKGKFGLLEREIKNLVTCDRILPKFSRRRNSYPAHKILSLSLWGLFLLLPN